jgi:hypothetical protein
VRFSSKHNRELAWQIRERFSCFVVGTGNSLRLNARSPTDDGVQSTSVGALVAAAGERKQRLLLRNRLARRTGFDEAEVPRRVIHAEGILYLQPDTSPHTIGHDVGLR